jgi:polar amino acid transport system substrate-binding protein
MRSYHQICKTLTLSLLLFCIVACTSSSKRASPYVIARGTAWENVNLFGAEKNLIGFSSDLLLEIGRIEQIPIRETSSSVSPILSLLNTGKGKVDGVLTAIQPDTINQEQYHFSDPYFLMGPVLIVKSSSPYQGLQDLQNHEIGFERNYVWALKIKNGSDIILRPYDDANKVIANLVDNDIDGAIVDAIVAYKLLSSDMYKNVLRIAGKPLLTMGLRLAVKKGHNEELIIHFNRGLETLRASGLYQKMVRYWGLFDAYVPQEITSP